MDLATRKSLLRSLSQAYKRALWKEKNQIIDQVVLATGYRRDYALYMLLHPTVSPIKKSKKIRIGKYVAIISPLRKIYGISNFASGKRGGRKNGSSRNSVIYSSI